MQDNVFGSMPPAKPPDPAPMTVFTGQINSVVRNVISAGAGALVGWAVSKGIIPGTESPVLTEALTTFFMGLAVFVAPVIWGWLASSRDALIKRVSHADGVVKVVASAQIANSPTFVNNDKVVSPPEITR